MMNNTDIQDIFADCVDRILGGETLESCLRRYPTVAGQLRAMLEAALPIRQLTPSVAEVLEDQAWVWAQIQDRIPSGDLRGGEPSSRRPFRFVLLLAATLILFAGVVVFGSGLIDHDDEVQLLPTATVTQSATSVSPTATQTSTATQTVTATTTTTSTETVTQTLTATETTTATITATQTSTPTPTATQTHTRTPRPSRTPSMTPSPAPTLQLGACGAYLTEEEVRQQVLAIYPNTTITRIEQDERYSGTLIWEVRTSHGVRLIIEAECGTILELSRSGSDSVNSGSGSDDNSGSGSDNSGSDDSDDDSSDDHDNSGHGGGGSDD